MRWEERLKIIKIARFEIDLLKTNEGIAPQSRETLQTSISLCPHHTNVCKFSQLCKAISSLT